jgi:hypothetical protein
MKQRKLMHDATEINERFFAAGAGMKWLDKLLGMMLVMIRIRALICRQD